MSLAIEMHAPWLRLALARTARSGWLRFAVIFVAATGIIVARRWPQFAHPAIWIEEASEVIPRMVAIGGREVLRETGGYLIIPSKLIIFLALTISFSHYALVATVLTTIVQAACVGVIAAAPTHLPSRYACALAVALVPIGVEVFAVPLHGFWFTSLLLFPALLWHAEVKRGLRIVCLVVAGLSSPLVGALAPAFVMRAIVERRTREYVVCAIVLGFGALHGVTMLTSNTTGSSIVSALLQPAILVPKYVGTAFYQFDLDWAGILGWLLLLLLPVGALQLKRGERLYFRLLLLCLGGCVLSSVGRVPVTAPHPLLAGPRYFFYPVVVMLWLLIWLATRAPRPTAMIAALCITLYGPALVTDFDWAQEKPRKDWTAQVHECGSAQGAYTFEAQFADMWNMVLQGADCRRLLDQQLLD